MILDLRKPLDRQKFKEYANKLFIDECKVELKKLQAKRTISQNNYLHVVISLFAIAYGENEHVTKQLLKHWFGLHKEVKGVLIYTSTSTLDKVELTKFIDFIRTKAIKDLGSYIPTAQEYLENQFEIRKELEAAKEFLK